MTTEVEELELNIRHDRPGVQHCTDKATQLSQWMQLDLPVLVTSAMPDVIYNRKNKAL